MSTQNKYTFFHRLLHWVMALALSVQFITGFLRMKWMGKNAVREALESQGLDVSKDEAKAVYKALRESMWQWHEVFAHVVIFTFIARIIYMAVKGIRFPKPFKKGVSLKERFQGLTYVYFYLFVIVQAVTGIMLKNKILADMKHEIESIHKWGLYLFPIFILLHLIGVLIAEHSEQKGISSKMIAGE